VTHIELELYKARKTRKVFCTSLTIATVVLSLIVLPWVTTFSLASLVAIVTWGVLSEKVERLEDQRTIRRD
jgi:threonine/homoserine efflux transporter RhtA